MNYFGGYGAGRGWFSFRFLIASDELRNVLLSHGIHLVTTNGRVLVDYLETPLDEYITAYDRFLRAIAGDGDIEDWTIRDPIRTSLTATMGIIQGKQITRYPEYKLLELSEPVISLDSFPLIYTGSSISVSWGGEYRHTFGIIMNYPKAVSFTAERCANEYDGASYVNYPLYESLKRAINGIAHGCKIQSPTSIHRIDAQISPAAKRMMQDAPVLYSQELALL